MTELFVDLNKLIASIDIISNLESSTTSSTKTEIENNIRTIKLLGEKHDSCFNSISAETLINCIDDTASDLLDLISNINSTIRFTKAYSKGADTEADAFFSKYTNDNDIKFKIHGVVNAMKWDIEDANRPLSEKISQHELRAGYDYRFYNYFLDSIHATTDSQREKAVLNAIFMTTIFPHMPYFWGGGHDYDVDGVDPRWGMISEIKDGDDPDQPKGSLHPLSFDCSGFVDWLIYNSGFDRNQINYSLLADDYASYGTTLKMKTAEAIDILKPGDLAHMDYYKGDFDPHVGMIVSKKGAEITIAHCCGRSGITLTTMDINTGKIIDDSASPDRIGEDYFTDFVALNYDS